jgi:hypothetical protein
MVGGADAWRCCRDRSELGDLSGEFEKRFEVSVQVRAAGNSSSELLAGYPQYTGDVIASGDPRFMARPQGAGGKREPEARWRVQQDSTSSTAPSPARRAGPAQRPIDGLPIYNDYIASYDDVWPAAGDISCRRASSRTRRTFQARFCQQLLALRDDAVAPRWARCSIRWSPCAERAGRRPPRPLIAFDQNQNVAAAAAWLRGRRFGQPGLGRMSPPCSSGAD